MIREQTEFCLLSFNCGKQKGVRTIVADSDGVHVAHIGPGVAVAL